MREIKYRAFIKEGHLLSGDFYLIRNAYEKRLLREIEEETGGLNHGK